MNAPREFDFVSLFIVSKGGVGHARESHELVNDSMRGSVGAGP